MHARFLKAWNLLRNYTATPSRKARRSVRLAVEVLEDRAVPTANASGVVSGLVYVDTNGNGIHDAKEAILPGAPVTLTGVTTQNVAVSVTAKTDFTGSFTFLNVLPGNYS